MERNKEKNSIQRFPLHSVSEGIINNQIKEKSQVQEDRSEIKDSNSDNTSGCYINTPGVELDVVQQSIISEFEENNFYCFWC